MARYVKLEISEQDKKFKALRDEAKELREGVLKAQESGDEDAAKELTAKLVKIPVSSGAIFGDREVLKVYLGVLPQKGGENLRRYFNLMNSLEKSPDEGFWEVSHEDWKWMRTEMDKVDYSQKNKDGDYLIPASLRYAFGKVNIQIEDAKETKD